MRKLLLLAAGFLMLTMSTTARAEVQVSLRMGFPAVLPPLVEVQPGVRVVQDFDEEVFFVGGYYWVQRDGNWYRARDHRGTWRYVKPGGVPAALVQHEPGRYRRWQHDERRSWPAVQHARADARHWGPADHQERSSSNDGHRQDRQKKEKKEKKGKGHDGDRREQDRR